ncbi:hypothetical protein C0991_003142 [Blastosporella zonata]|nr:hypothetical protein C0991_003142 [Blastosporella zonata]
MKDDDGDGHWFNLNSFLSEPEWVGKLYLGMVLQQAENEGYSVFAITQVDPSAPLGLPRTVPDEIASTLPEPTSSNLRTSSNRPLASISAPEAPAHIEGFDDEDYELQAALQASLMGAQFGAGGTVSIAPPRLAPSFIPLPPGDSESFQFSDLRTDIHTSANVEEDEDLDAEDDEQSPSANEQADVDPVAESMTRNRLMLQRMRAHQELAQRELWGEGSLSEADAAALEARRSQRQLEELEEAEELRRAIAESEALAQAQGHATHDDMDEEVDELDIVNVARPGPVPLQGLHPTGGHGVGHRVYDDDDADLQAALRASLEGVPQGWEFPELPPQPVPSRPISVPVDFPPAPAPVSEHNKDAEDAESVLSTEPDDHPSSEAPLDADELRRKRLARFGM